MMNDDRKAEILKMEYNLVQDQIDKNDQMSVRVRTWAMTLWIASLGWYFQVNQREIIALAVFAVVLFWTLDAAYTNFREGYKRRRIEIGGALQKIAEGEVIGHFPTPAFPVHRYIDSVRYFMMPHVALFYISLIIVASVLFIRG